MSALLQLVTSRDGSGHILMALGTAAPDHFHNGLPFDASGALAGENSGASHYHQGLGFTSNSRLSVAGGAAVRFNAGAMPMTTAGRLSAGVLPLNHFSSGVAYNVTSKVIFSSPVTPFEAVTNDGIDVTDNGVVVTNG